jgi:signal transduction histidine kinase
MKVIGRLAAGVAHEVKNPLAIIEMGLTLLRQEPFATGSEAPQILDDIADAVRRADAVIKGLLDFSSPKNLELSTHDLNATLGHALTLTRGEWQPLKIKVEKELDPTLPLVPCDRMKISQVFVNLIINAAHAMKVGGTLTLRTTYRQITSPGHFPVGERVVAVEICDSGTGIPDAQLSKIFDPFFTTKPTGKGTGLGLTVTKSIIDLHGGTIEVCNRPEGGACFVIQLKV